MCRALEMRRSANLGQPPRLSERRPGCADELHQSCRVQPAALHHQEAKPREHVTHKSSGTVMKHVLQGVILTAILDLILVVQVHLSSCSLSCESKNMGIIEKSVKVQVNVALQPASFAQVIAQLLGVCFQEDGADIRSSLDLIEQLVEVLQCLVANDAPALVEKWRRAWRL